MKTSSRFYSALGWLIALNLIVKPVWVLGIDRQVQNSTGPSEYGAYFSLYNLSIVFGFLLDWGLTNWYNRHLAADRKEFIDKAGAFFFIKLLFALIYAMVVFGFGLLAGIDRTDILWGVILIQITSSWLLFLRAVITAEQRFKAGAWLSVLDKIFVIVVCGAVFLFPGTLGEMEIWKFIVFQILCTVAAIFIALVLLYGRGISFSFTGVHTVLTKKVFLSALPYALLLLLMSAHARLDGFLLERIYPEGDNEAGIYASSYRLLDAANMPGILLASFILPYIARRHGKAEGFGGVVINTRHLLLCFSVCVASVCFFMAPWLHDLLYDFTGYHAAKVLQWCIPALIGYSLVCIYGTVMTATGHVSAFCFITLTALLFNLAINLLLIPVYGALACCIAAITSQFCCGIAALLYVERKLGIPLHARSVFIYIFLALALCGYLYLANREGIGPWWKISGALVITIVVILFTNLFNRNRLISLFRENIM